MLPRHNFGQNMRANAQLRPIMLTMRLGNATNVDSDPEGAKDVREAFQSVSSQAGFLQLPAGAGAPQCLRAATIVVLLML